MSGRIHGWHSKGARGTGRWTGPASGNLVNAIVTSLLFTLEAGGTLRRCCWEVGAAPVEAPLKGGAEAALSAFQSPPQGWKQKKYLFHIETNCL